MKLMLLVTAWAVAFVLIMMFFSWISNNKNEK